MRADQFLRQPAEADTAAIHARLSALALSKGGVVAHGCSVSCSLVYYTANANRLAQAL